MALLTAPFPFLSWQTDTLVSLQSLLPAGQVLLPYSTVPTAFSCDSFHACLLHWATTSACTGMPDPSSPGPGSDLPPNRNSTRICQMSRLEGMRLRHCSKSGSETANCILPKSPTPGSFPPCPLHVPSGRCEGALFGFFKALPPSAKSILQTILPCTPAKPSTALPNQRLIPDFVLGPPPFPRTPASPQ